MLRRLLLALPLLALVSCAAVPGAQSPVARLDRLEIVSRAQAFGGVAFDGAGEYEKIVAIAHMRINPADPANRLIADLDKARADGGWVRYRTDVIIVRPRAASAASKVLIVDVPNRGGRLMPVMFNDGGASLDSAAAAAVGNGFAMRRGHTLAWIGWQGDIALSGDGSVAGADFPLATDGGKPITGLSFAEAVFDDGATEGEIALPYPAATQEPGSATLTVRATATGPARVLPPDAWRFKGAHAIALRRPSGYDAGAIYRIDYLARDARVMGLGMAALRDVTSYLKSGLPDGAGQANPLADIKPAVTLAVGVSQSGRFLRDLIWQGFNQDPRGGKVFDGAMPLIAGSRKSYVNVRFGQPGRYSTQHLDQVTYGDQFPFSYGVTRDPVGGATDGIFARCQASATCPKLMHVDSSVEFWQGRASLVVTDGAGADIALPADVRAYLMASTQHMSAARPSTGVCRYASNPAQQGPAVRALLDRLVDWTRAGTPPPASRYPRLADAMLTAPERDAVGFPDLRAAGVQFPSVINQLALVDYSGQRPRLDPARTYQVLVPMTDADGHDIAGIRLPDVAAPLATHAGWNLRRKGYADGQLCGLNGLYLPLPATPRAGDPRRALSQRYTSRIDYARAVALAARELRDQGLLLQEDVDRYIERAKIDSRIQP